VRPAGRSGAGLEEPGARGSAAWGAKLGSDGSHRRGRRIKGQRRGHRLARDAPGTLYKPSIGKNDEPDNSFPVFSPFLGLGKRRLALSRARRPAVRAARCDLLSALAP